MNDYIKREDGLFYPRWMSELLDNDPPPKNPLEEKWKKEECGHISYSCMYCANCHFGEYWEVPEEDREEYEKYKALYEIWNKKHPEFEKHFGEIALEINLN